MVVCGLFKSCCLLYHEIMQICKRGRVQRLVPTVRDLTKKTNHYDQKDESITSYFTSEPKVIDNQVFVECDIAAMFWRKYLPLPVSRVVDKMKNSGEWCASIFLKMEGENRARFVAGLWAISNGRNLKVFENLSIGVEQLVSKAIHLLTATNDQEKYAGTYMIQAGHTDEVERVDGIGRVSENQHGGNATIGKRATLQFDGSWRYSQRLAGGGAIIYDHNGMALLAKAKKFSWGNRAKEIEALSLELGLDMAIELGIDSLTIEGDAKILLNETSGKNMDSIEDRSATKDIICSIKSKAAKFGNIHWHWIGRDKNTKAHRLASLGISIDGEELWYSSSLKHLFDSNVTNSELVASVL